MITCVRHAALPRPATLAGGLALCLALAVSQPATALDDGGGRSVFAHGAGERALALGGAYVAAADDASATIWNPGALGLLQRKSLQASHTNLIGLGFSEQYASLALPSWRLGTFAFTFRRFGVDGIEQRDDRNLLLDESLTDAETEVLLGYGHALNATWSLGANFKLQHQNLAGFSDTGLGVDAGLLFKPLAALGRPDSQAQALRLGLMVRNLIEPTLRLNEDPVPDPTGVRGGLAYDLALGGDLALLLAGDLEKTRLMNTRVHLGAELRLRRELALRVGSNDGVLSAGAGVRWKDIGVNYTFEDNPIGSVSRIGLGFHFGATTAESRHAALVREESRMRERMEDSFRQQNARRIDDFATQVRQQLDAEQWDDALNLAGMLKVVAPEDPRTPELEAAAWRGRGQAFARGDNLPEAMVSLTRALAIDPSDQASLAALAQVQEESRRRLRRTDLMAQLFQAGMDAFVAADLGAAAEKFKAVLDLAPGDKDAQAMLTRTNTLLAQEARARQAAEQTERTAAAAAARRAAATAAVETAAPVADEPTVPLATGLTAEEKSELEALYQRGLQAAEKGRTAEAVRYWELVWSLDPDYENVGDFLAQEYLARGLESFAAGNLSEAVRLWELALQTDPENPRARGYLERARQQLNHIQEISTN